MTRSSGVQTPSTGALAHPAASLCIASVGVTLWITTWAALFMFGVAVHRDPPTMLYVGMAFWFCLPLVGGALGLISAVKAMYRGATALPLVGGIASFAWLLLGATALLLAALGVSV